ncbi:MAG: hypothetical protein AAF657_28915 [Acidobacteriota bacterium]
MAAKLSKEVTARIRSGEFVLSALRQQGPQIAARMQALVEPHLRDSDATPSFAAQIVAYARTLEAALERLDIADQALLDERLRQNARRQARGRATGRLGQLLIGLRRTLRGLYAEPNLGRLGLAHANARNPLALARQADLASDHLRSETVQEDLGQPLFGRPFDPRPHAEELHRASAALQTILKDLDEIQRDVDLALIDKHRAQDHYDKIFLRVARGFEELCRFAEQDELADKVRPSRRRPGRTHVELGTREDEAPENTGVGLASSETNAEAEAANDEVGAPRAHSPPLSINA